MRCKAIYRGFGAAGGVGAGAGGRGGRVCRWVVAAWGSGLVVAKRGYYFLAEAAEDGIRVGADGSYEQYVDP